jgi:hypothetical protein
MEELYIFAIAEADMIYDHCRAVIHMKAGAGSYILSTSRLTRANVSCGGFGGIASVSTEIDTI